jgi:predicted phage-related endonuclease
MGQDEKALVRLWQEKRGEVAPEDLSGNLIVQLGLVTEDLNRHWYERNTGRSIIDIQSRVIHPVLPWMGATLDGVVAGTGAVYEAKFMLPWSFSEEAAAEKHMAQLQHNMWVTNVRMGPSPSSPAAVSGWRSRLPPIRSTSISFSRRKRSSGAA